MAIRTGDYLLRRLPYIICFVVLAIPLLINIILSFVISAETIIPTLQIISSNFYKIPIKSFILFCCVLSTIVAMPFSIRICKDSTKFIILSFRKHDVLKYDKKLAYAYLFFVILQLTIIFVLLTSFIWVVCVELMIAVLVLWITSGNDKSKQRV